MDSFRPIDCYKYEMNHFKDNQNTRVEENSARKRIQATSLENLAHNPARIPIDMRRIWPAFYILKLNIYIFYVSLSLNLIYFNIFTEFNTEVGSPVLS